MNTLQISPIAHPFTRCTPATLPKKMLKTYVAALLKIAADAVPEVRENVFSALGAAWKVRLGIYEWILLFI